MFKYSTVVYEYDIVFIIYLKHPINFYLSANFITAVYKHFRSTFNWYLPVLLLNRNSKNLLHSRFLAILCVIYSRADN